MQEPTLLDLTLLNVHLTFKKIGPYTQAYTLSHHTSVNPVQDKWS